MTGVVKAKRKGSLLLDIQPMRQARLKQAKETSATNVFERR